MNRVETDPITGVTRIVLSVHRDRKAWEAVASVLKDERVRQEMTTTQVASTVGEITPQYVGMIERGKRKPSLDVLVHILEALHLGPTLEQDGRAVSFYTDEGKTHITVQLRPAPSIYETVTPAWKAEQDVEDARKIGEIVRAISSDRDFLLFAYRQLGFDEEYNYAVDMAEAAAERARGK